MTEAAPVQIEEVRRVAELASLELTDAEEQRLGRDLNAILAYVGQLSELDVEGVEPMSQVAEVLGHAEDPTGPLRPDSVTPSLDRGRVMAAAPETDGAFFKVPKVIER